MEHYPPSSLESLLERGLEELGAATDRTAPLADFARLVSRWGERMNLTGHSGPDAIARRLVLDAVALGCALEEPTSLADLGSGAGFPGIPLAILWPRARITLIESRERRHHFQRTAIRALGLRNVESRHGRAEVIEASTHAIAIAQAMGEPTEILDWMTPASVYHNEINFNKNRKDLKSGQKLCQQNGH